MKEELIWRFFIRVIFFKLKVLSLFQYLETESNKQYYTRDVLLVKGTLHNETLHIIGNHWSSRREGVKETKCKLLAASDKVNTIIKAIKKRKTQR